MEWRYYSSSALIIPYMVVQTTVHPQPEGGTKLETWKGWKAWFVRACRALTGIKSSEFGALITYSIEPMSQLRKHSITVYLITRWADILYTACASQYHTSSELLKIISDITYICLGWCRRLLEYEFISFCVIRALVTTSYWRSDVVT